MWVLLSMSPQSANVQWELMTVSRLYNEWRARGAHGSGVLHTRLAGSDRGNDIVVRLTGVGKPASGQRGGPALPGTSCAVLFARGLWAGCRGIVWCVAGLLSPVGCSGLTLAGCVPLSAWCVTLCCVGFGPSTLP